MSRPRGQSVGDTIRHELEEASRDLADWACHPCVDPEEDQIEGRFYVLRHRLVLAEWQRYVRTSPKRWRLDQPEPGGVA